MTASLIKVWLVDNTKMAEFYFTKNLDALAVGLFVEGFYNDAGEFAVEGTGEDAAEEVFDLTNNPSRQGEREQLYGRKRSVSVGDMVEVDGDLWLCCPRGWWKISVDVATA